MGVLTYGLYLFAVVNEGKKMAGTCLRLEPAATFSAKLPHLKMVLGRSSGFRILLLSAPSRPLGQWHLGAFLRSIPIADFVPGYSSATATDSHRTSLGPFSNVLSDHLLSNRHFILP